LNMKIGDFLPDIVQNNTQLVQGNQWLNKLYDMGFTGFLKSQYGQNAESATQYYGIEQLYFDWLRQAYAYRRMFIQDLYLLAFDCSEIRTPLFHLKKEIFRKGFDEWHPKFVLRCDKCNKDFQEEEEAKDHKNHGLRRPDISQIKDFDRKWRKSCNIFNQDLESVLNTVEDDLNIVDDAYIHLNKRYKNINGKTWTELLEIRRIHPALIEFDLDKNGLPKNSHWFCLYHRDNVEIHAGKCSTTDCNEEMLPAMYVYNHRGGRVYLLEDELIHISKFSPHETYGYSPILTLMQKVLTVSGMDRFLYRYFFERKTPTQMILTNTDDPQSLEIERARMEAKMMEDPYYTPWIAVSNRTGRGKTDIVRLFHTLHEMDYLNVRNEIRDRIAGIYSVPQMFYNVMEGVSGLAGQTQQLKMMANAVAADQRMFNEKIIPVILKNTGVTDWEIKLRTPEEKIEGEVLQLAQQKVAIATAMRQMGYNIKLKPGAWDIESMDFSFSGKAMSLQEQQQMMMGGMAGGGMAPGMGPGGSMPVQVDEQGNVVAQGAEDEGGRPAENPNERKEALHIGKDEDDKKTRKHVRPKKHRLEEELYDIRTPAEEEEEEEDNAEEDVF
jgi:hypothetical protein